MVCESWRKTQCTPVVASKSKLPEEIDGEIDDLVDLLEKKTTCRCRTS